MAEKLESCPFCGGKAYFKCEASINSYGSVGFEFEIECNSCKIKLPHRYGIKLHLGENGELEITKDEREIAIEDWNRRNDE